MSKNTQLLLFCPFSFSRVLYMLLDEVGKLPSPSAGCHQLAVHRVLACLAGSCFSSLLPSKQMSRDYRTERLVEMKPGRLRDELNRQLIKNYSSVGYQADRVVVEYSTGEQPIWVLLHEVIEHFPLGPQNPRLLGKWILPTSVSAGEWVQGATIEEEERETAQAIEVERKRHENLINFASIDPPVKIKSTWPELAPDVFIGDEDEADYIKLECKDPRLFLAVDLPLWLTIWKASECSDSFRPEELVQLYQIVVSNAEDNEGDSREVQGMCSPEDYCEQWTTVEMEEVEEVAGQEFEDCCAAAEWCGGWMVHHDNGPTILVSREDFGQLAEARIRELTAERLGGEA